MQINIDKPGIKKPRRRKPSNPVWSVIWRFLLFCAIVDGGIYFYFHKVENITVAEGIRQLRAKIHGNQAIETVDYPKYPVIEVVEFEVSSPKQIDTLPARNVQIAINPHTVKNASSTELALQQSKGSQKDEIYCWEDENNIRHYSNTGYPTTGYYKIVSME